MLKLFLAATFFASLGLSAIETKTETTAIEQDALDFAEADRSAKDWLKLVDDEKYAESWEQAAIQLKLTMSKTEWVRYMDLRRKTLGRVRTRVVQGHAPAKDPKGLPAGAYMLIQYGTQFALGKEQSTELVTLIQDSHGKWKVMSYFFKS